MMPGGVFDWHSQDSRATGPLTVAHTISAQYGTGGGNAPMVIQDGGSIDCRHMKVNGEISGTLQANGRSLNAVNPVLCRATTNSNAETAENKAVCLTCRHEAPLIAMEEKPQTSYIVRRLIPLECGRLQGFPDGWGEIAPLDADNESDLDLWRRVYKTNCEIKESKTNTRTRDDPKALAAWHDGLHSTSAEYKMWGNGMALPNALFFIQRAIRQIQEETGRAPDEIKLGSLFDGSGTMPLAAEMCGARAVWASEVEPYPIAVTRTHLPYMKHIGSVTEIRGGEIEPVDIITFGSPCQDLSIAGKRAGLEGARSGLFMEAVRIIREMRQATEDRYPRFAIWENVPGALSSNGGKDFETVLNEMLRLARPGEFIRQRGRWRKAENYGALAYRIVDAQYWGVPQRRRRIYLVTDFGGESAGVVTFERKGTAWDFEPRIPSPGFAGGGQDCRTCS
jgi:site-specific DNA-cytosine methylase